MIKERLGSDGNRASIKGLPSNETGLSRAPSLVDRLSLLIPSKRVALGIGIVGLSFVTVSYGLSLYRNSNPSPESVAVSAGPVHRPDLSYEDLAIYGRLTNIGSGPESHFSLDDCSCERTDDGIWFTRDHVIAYDAIEVDPLNVPVDIPKGAAYWDWQDLRFKTANQSSR